MTRWSYRFELDSSKQEHNEVIDRADDLKSINKFSTAVRDGLRIMYDIIINDDLAYIISDQFMNRYHNRRSVKDLRRALNLIIAIEKGDIEFIFTLYPHLIQPMIRHSIQFTGLGNHLSVGRQIEQPSIQDSFTPKEIPFNQESAIQKLLT